MTWPNHVAEIARQGIWASLTGGWCYEPANSIFCNTLHLYVWSTLLVLPILLGIFAGSDWSLFFAYIAFVAVGFTILKLVVSYLHRIFDTTEPIITYKTKKSVPAEPCRSPLSSFSARATESNLIEMVELADHRRLSGDTPEDGIYGIADGAVGEKKKRHAAADDSSDAEETDVYQAIFPVTKMRSIYEDDSSSGSSKTSANELLTKKERAGTLLPADSLELFPLPRRQSENETLRRSYAYTRKYSEPSFEPLTGKRAGVQRRLSEERPFSMRRAQSFAEKRATSERIPQSAPATKQSLDAANYKFRKSYPAKTKSTDIFLDEVDKSRDRPKTRLISPAVELEDEPCCSKSLMQEETTKKEHEEHDVTEEPQPSTSKDVEPRTAADNGPPPMALHRTMDHIGLHRPYQPTLLMGLEAPNTVHDLKGQITKFLEELIDKHPETLDAIESVRMNRLGGRYPVLAASLDRDRSSFETAHETLSHHSRNDSRQYSLNLHDGRHVAYDHEDTSQGAVHSFQDEHGNWWTYAFDEQGGGTAQALGSSHAIYEMLMNRNSARSVPASSTARSGNASDASQIDRRLAFLVGQPSANQPSTSGLSRVPAHTRPRRAESAHARHDSKASSQKDGDGWEREDQKAVADSTVRRRRNSTTSEDSDSGRYIPTLPTSVFRPTNSASNSPMELSAYRPREDANAARSFVSITTGLASRIYSQAAGRGPYTTSALGTSAGMGPLQSRPRMALENFAENQNRRRGILTIGAEPPPDRGEYVRLCLGSDVLGRGESNVTQGTAQTPSLSSMNTVRLFNDLQSLHAQHSAQRSAPRQSRTKVNYYYKLKFIPKAISGDDGFKINLDRLAVAALFDRNNSVFSGVFDVILAVMVTALASLLISRGIYADFSLLLFAFVVAGSQFSLMKSVQPDASSPVHGFNWLVAYSRPVYFCIFGALVALLDWKLWYPHEKSTLPYGFEIGWNWNPYHLSSTSVKAILIGLRDLFATLILLLPAAFTIGILPQVTTLAMHVLEQVDMHVFGGTASFSLLSASLAILRSILAVGFLCGVGHLAHYVDPNSTQNVAFAGYVALTISLAYLKSRWSTNPLYLRILLSNLLQCGDFVRPVEDTLQGDRKPTESPASPQMAKERRRSGSYRRKSESIGKISEQRSRLSSWRATSSVSSVGQSAFASGQQVEDPLPKILRNTLLLRVHHDMLFFLLITLVVFALHTTSVFNATQPYFQVIIFSCSILFGVFNHYVYHQLRTHTPWKLFARPILRAHEFGEFETTVEAKLTLFEKIHVWAIAVEKNVLHPLLVTSLMTLYAWKVPLFPVPLTALFAFRIARTAYAQPQLLYVPLLGAFVISVVPFHADSRTLVESNPLMVLYLLLAVWPKVQELVLKMNFILAYIAPWQISWGSAFHAFAQPFSIPHTGFICAQATISSILSAPLNPFLGSSFFMMSYVRPVKFWEKDYNTKRVDHSTLRLSSQLDRGPMVDDSNLNAIFYEHLTRSLQRSLAGDLLLGRWASSVQPGDCFILASLYLNCLVHIIEVGNGFVTFQVRGLEFRGTYCHQREVEAISEDWTDGGGCCCCTIGSLPSMLSFNNAWALRWLAWEVTSAKYVIDGYSITDNSAVNLLQVHELRRLLVTLYVKCISYYALNSPRFDHWIQNEAIAKALEPIKSNGRYTDVDPMFCAANDEDYDLNLMGVSRQSFLDVYGDWIQYCLLKRNEARSEFCPPIDASSANAFCFAISILGRRALGAASYNRHANAAESFLFGLHALFKGDLRVTSVQDEWVLSDPDILSTVISPAVRMALKLHQDHFAAADDFEEIPILYDRVKYYDDGRMFISHEHDPAWRQAIIANTPSLLALRHMYDDGQDDYKIIMLNRSHLNLRVIKLNRECVRAFWAGQQQELIFLRNRNPERGSIQNARQVLRNMINSSADQPIGYPIYVSPLTTSFVETHNQISRITGRPLTFCAIWSSIRRLFTYIRRHWRTSGSSNLAAASSTAATAAIPMSSLHPIGPAVSQAGSTPAPYRKRTNTSSHSTVGGGTLVASFSAGGASISRSSQERQPEEVGGNSPTNVSIASDAAADAERKKSHPSPGNEESFSGTEKDAHEAHVVNQKTSSEAPDTEFVPVEIVDADKVLRRLNEPMKATGEYLVAWPKPEWRMLGGQTAWKFPISSGAQGLVVHSWSPFHPNKLLRSHAGHIFLVHVEGKDGEKLCDAYVPVLEDGLRFLNKTTSSGSDAETNV
ncbi:Pecanex [Aphelenchoides avenae]|nr:Pecanex [Aphelenchus avenae]